MGEVKAKTTRIGSDNLCPIQCVGSAWEIEAHCHDKCEWNDGGGCAVWRIVKALEQTKERLDGIQNALAELNTEILQHRR